MAVATGYMTPVTTSVVATPVMGAQISPAVAMTPINPNNQLHAGQITPVSAGRASPMMPMYYADGTQAGSVVYSGYTTPVALSAPHSRASTPGPAVAVLAS